MNSTPITEDRFESLLDEVDSIEFDTAVNLASDLSMARRIVSIHPAIEALLRACEGDRWLVTSMYARIMELCHRGIDLSYASPHDSAIFALLFALARCEPLLGAMAAEAALEAPNAYWTSRLANDLVQDVHARGLLMSFRRKVLDVIAEALRPARSELRVKPGGLSSTLTGHVQEVAFQ